MSAFISVRFPDSIQLLADGAAYNPEGVITSFEDKIRVSRRAPVAVAVRGASGLALGHGQLICDLADQEGVEELLRVLRSYDTSLNARRYFKADETAGFDFAIALWHPAEGPKHYRLHSYPTLPGFAPFVLHELGDFTACGTVFHPDELFRAGILPVYGDPTDWARTKGGDIMDMMRQSKGEPLPGAIEKPQYIIGGHVDLATVTATGVKLQRIRRYTDKIGKKIDPKQDRKAITPADSMSRQQRRALERKAKRSAA